MTSDLDELINEINLCSKCGGLVIDKPCLIHSIYRKYIPNKPLILAISESPPPGHKKDYLYNTEQRDRLREALAEAIGINEKEVIKFLYSKHIFWTTAVKCRPVSKETLEDLRRNCRSILELEIATLQPDVIVALGRTAQRSLSELNIKPDLSCYHPLYYSRRKNLNELRGKLEELMKLINERFNL